MCNLRQFALTREPIDRILVKEMLTELLEHQFYDLLPIGQTVAAWLLGSVDLEWLQKEYMHMLDFFEDSPAYHWMTDSALEKGRLEGREKGRLEGREEGRLEGREEGHLEEVRQIIEAVMQARFPVLLPLAMNRVEQMSDLTTLRQLLFTVSTARSARAVKKYLLALQENNRQTEQDM